MQIWCSHSVLVLGLKPLFGDIGHSSHALANTVFIHDMSKLGTEFTSDRVYKQCILNKILPIIFKTVLNTRQTVF